MLLHSLTSIDFASERGVLELDGARLSLSSHRLSNFVARAGAMYQFIGELSLLDDAEVVWLNLARAGQRFAHRAPTRSATMSRRARHQQHCCSIVAFGASSIRSTWRSTNAHLRSLVDPTRSTSAPSQQPTPTLRCSTSSFVDKNYQHLNPDIVSSRNKSSSICFSLSRALHAGDCEETHGGAKEERRRDVAREDDAPEIVSHPRIGRRVGLKELKNSKRSVEELNTTTSRRVPDICE